MVRRQNSNDKDDKDKADVSHYSFSTLKSFTQKKKKTVPKSTVKVFTIGAPADPEHLVDRTREVEDLVSLLSNPRINYNVALIGHRRIGKTSILKKVQQELEAKGNITVVTFDVKRNMGAPSIFFERLAREIFDAYVKHLKKSARFRRKAGNYTSKTIQAITTAFSSKRVGGVGIETSMSEGKISITPKIELIESQQQPDYQKTMDTVFSTARAFAESSKTRFVVMLDEFQDILKLKRYRGLHNIVDLFRSIVQERGSKVAYVICGSQVNTIKKLLEQGDSSLFLHSKEYQVGELDHDSALELFESYARARGVMGREKLGRLRVLAQQAFDIVGGHPFYLMLLAEAWNEKTGEAIKDTFERELEAPTGSIHVYEEHVLTEDLKDAQGGPMLRTILQIIAGRRDPLSDEPIPSTLTDVAKPLRKRRIQELEPYLGELEKFGLVNKNESDHTYLIRDKVLDQYLKIEAQQLNKKIVLQND